MKSETRDNDFSSPQVELLRTDAGSEPQRVSAGALETQEGLIRGDEGKREVRDRRIRLALLASMGQKATTFGVQVLALPVGIKALGVDRFGVFATLTALLGLISVAQMGVSPALTRRIASLEATHDSDREAACFSSAFFSILLVGFFIPAICAVIAYGLPVVELLGPSYVPYSGEVKRGIVVLSCLLAAQLVERVVEAARAGYQEVHINNVCVMIGNSLSFVLIVVVALYWPTIDGLLVAFYGGNVIGGLINGMHLVVVARPYLIPHMSRFDINLVKPMLREGLDFITVDVSGLLNRQVSLLTLGRFLGPAAVAQFAVLFQMVLLALGAVIMFAQPLWAAIAEAATRRDMYWVRQTYRNMVLLAMTYSTGVGLAIALGGQFIIEIWIGPEMMTEPSLRYLMGLYFVIFAWFYLHYIFAAGLGVLRRCAPLLLVETCLVAALCVILSGPLGVAAPAAALGIAALGISGWLFPLVVRKAMK